MSSSNYSNSTSSQGWCANGSTGPCKGGHWSVANIAAMVLGFIIFAPLGLIILVWTLMGRPVQDLPASARNKWNELSGKMRSAAPGEESDNVVFREYQQTQYDRIREIKDEIRRRAEAFRAFRFDAKRRQDQKEFEDFMARNPDNTDTKR